MQSRPLDRVIRNMQQNRPYFSKIMLSTVRKCSDMHNHEIESRYSLVTRFEQQCLLHLGLSQGECDGIWHSVLQRERWTLAPTSIEF